jgi:hypothetical protein
MHAHHRKKEGKENSVTKDKIQKKIDTQWNKIFSDNSLP